jgi:hypothetical protein
MLETVVKKFLYPPTPYWMGGLSLFREESILAFTFVGQDELNGGTQLQKLPPEI